MNLSGSLICSSLNEIESALHQIKNLKTRLVRQSLRQNFPQISSLKSYDQTVF